MTEDEKTALLDDIDEGLEQLGPSRPNAARVTRAKTIFRKVRVACQNIPISPATADGGTVTPPPTPGPETPPIDPAPPETPPSGGGGGGSTSPPTTTTVTTTYTSQGDFVGTQGYRGWTYLDGNLEETLTYDATRQLWTGPQLYQFIWNTGCHSGPTVGVVRRFTSPSAGTYSITGSILFYDQGLNGTSALPVTIKKNGATIYGPQSVAAGDFTGYAIANLTGSIAIDDTLDFIVGPPSGPGTAHDNLNSVFSIAITTTTTTGGGSTTQTTLPFTLNGTAPEEGTYTLTANKPSNADGCTIAITGVNLAASYGRCYVNGSSNSVAVWATAPGNAGISATVSLSIPVAYMVNGSNTLRFTHDSGAGYTITAIGTPVFTTPVTPTPPATQTSLPFVLTGSILPEDALLTVSLSKPSNANGATMTVTGVNLTGEMGAYYINGQLASVIWADTPANAGVSASVVRTPNVSLFQNGNNTIRFTHTSGSGYTITAVSVNFTVPAPSDPPPVPPPGTGTWPQLPSDATVFLNHSCSTILAPGMTGGVGGNGGLRSDSTAPLSPPQCIMTRLEVGTQSGGAQLEYYLPAGNSYRELYCGIYWRTNPQWTGRATNDKMFFLRGNNSNGYFGLLNGITKGGGNPRFFFGHNSGNVDNSHIMSLDLGLEGRSNVSSSEIIPGQWTRIEVQLRTSTTLISRDGIVRWWVNGVLCGNYTTLNYGTAATGLNNFVWTETWDGSGTPVHPVPLEHWIDHIIVAGKN